MIFQRSFVPVALLTFAVVGSAGCRQEPPSPTAEPATSASTSGKARPSPRAPTPMAKVDPQSMKEYRSDVCYFGTLSLRQARDAYLASVGKDEPSEKKIPNFGLPSAPTATGTATPAAPGAKPATAPGAKPTTSATPTAAAAAKPATTAKPTAGATKPAASGSAAASAKPAAEAPKSATADTKQDMRRPFDLAMRAQHDRNARACKVASDLKDPAMPDLDAALAAFAPFALDLAKDISTASLYYQREDYKKDEFKQGKELHKKLVDSFAKLDELAGKVGSAITAWRKEHAPDPTKLDEGEKLANAAESDARDVFLGLLPKKIDLSEHKDRVAKLEKSIEALKAFGTSNAADVWSKNLGPSLDAFVRALKDAEPKVSEKGVVQDTFLSLVASFTNVIEARYRALTRALIAKGQTIEPSLRPAAPVVTRPATPRVNPSAAPAELPPDHPQ